MSNNQKNAILIGVALCFILGILSPSISYATADKGSFYWRIFRYYEQQQLLPFLSIVIEYFLFFVLAIASIAVCFAQRWLSRYIYASLAVFLIAESIAFIGSMHFWTIDDVLNLPFQSLLSMFLSSCQQYLNFLYVFVCAVFVAGWRCKKGMNTKIMFVLVSGILLGLSSDGVLVSLHFLYPESYPVYLIVERFFLTLLALIFFIPRQYWILAFIWVFFVLVGRSIENYFWFTKSDISLWMLLFTLGSRLIYLFPCFAFGLLLADEQSKSVSLKK